MAEQGVSIAFGNNTLDASPTWTRLDDPATYQVATSWTIKRGRQSELDKTITGTAEVTCLDRFGALDPTNTSGPFYGHLDPQKPALIAIQHPFTGIWHTIFRGFVDFYEHDLQMFGQTTGLDTVKVGFYDAFGILSGIELTPGVHGHTPSLANFPQIYYQGTPSNLVGESDVFVHVDDRIAKLLDDAGWPGTGNKIDIPNLRNIFSGNVSLQGSVYDRGDGLMSALADAADAEVPGVANIYVSKTGVITFHGRFARMFPTRAGYGIGFWKAGSMEFANGSFAAISSLSFRRAKDDLINSCGAWPQGVSDADVAGNLLENATSISKYGRRSETFIDLITSAGHDDVGNPTSAVTECHKFADYYVGNYKNPATRVTQISFVGTPDPFLGPAVWDLLCGVEISDVITLHTTHPGGGFNEDYFVEGITYTAQVGQPLRLDLDVSPRSLYSYNPFGTVDSSGA